MIFSFGKKNIFLVILFVLSIFYTFPFYRSGYFSTHDGEWSIIRLAEMTRELKDFQLPPRWSDYLNHGYGYPLFSFTYPFPYYLGSLLHFFGFGLTDAVKALFVTSVFLSALFMYLLGTEMKNPWAGLIAAIFYLTARYRLVNLYVRGSLGESLSLMLFPLSFYLVFVYFKKNRPIHLIFLSLTIGILILTHNVMAILFLPVLMIFTVYLLIIYKRSIFPVFFSYLIGLGLAAYFFIPALYEKKYLILSQLPLADLNENFINITEYLSSRWNYGIRPSFSLGIGFLIIILISLIEFFTNKFKNKHQFMPGIFLIVLFIYLFLTNSAAALFWKIPPLSWIDFPWRLLGPITFLVSALVITTNNINYRIILALAAIFTIFANYQLVKPRDNFEKPDVYYQTNDATTTSFDELMPLWVKEKAKNRYENKAISVNNYSSILNLSYNSRYITFEVESRENDQIIINTIYFPGWTFWLDDKKIQTEIHYPAGLIKINTEKGLHKIRGSYLSTTVRWVADAVSIISLFSLIFYSIWKSNINRLLIYAKKN